MVDPYAKRLTVVDFSRRISWSFREWRRLPIARDDIEEPSYHFLVERPELNPYVHAARSDKLVGFLRWSTYIRPKGIYLGIYLT